MIALVGVLVFQSLDSLPERRLVMERQIVVADSGEPWGHVGSVVTLPSSQLVVVDRSRSSPVRLDASGRSLGPLMRVGDGPGEAREAMALGVTNGALWVWDRRLQRLTVFDSLLRLVRLTTIGRFVDVAIPLADGRFLGLGARSPGDNDLVFLRLEESHARIDTILRVTAPIRFLEIRLKSGGQLRGPQPFDDGEILALFGDASGWILTDRQASGSPLVTVCNYRSDGTIRWKRSYSYFPVGLSGDQIDFEVNRLVAPMGTRGPVLDRDRVRSLLFIPPRLPPIASVLTGEDGSVWLRRSGQAGAYVMLDRDGIARYRVSVPNGSRLVGAKDGVAWVAQQAEEGEETLVRYRIE